MRIYYIRSTIWV